MFMYSDYSQHLLDHVKKIHFIGCGGSGMYPLIQILAAKGYELSGSDVLDGSIIRYEREMGVKVSLGHNADNVVGADMVVYSAAISKDNVELNAAASYGIPTVERSVLLGYVSRLYKQSICVSGTHGKTTTTSMITTALELAGRDPSAVIGGKLPLINGYGKAGKGDDIVIEACEFAETFLKLTPYLSVVLNIDNDHLDYYGSMGELKFAFKRFALMTQFMIFANADDKNTMDVMYTLDRRVRTFAIDNHGDYRAVNVNEYKPGFFEFDLKEWNTTDTTRIRLSVPGRHNIYNALAMCAVCRFVGLSAEQCAEAALNFKGAGRRFEVYGECNGALVIDDYAHHPTELRATLNTAKEMGYKRLIAVHQPFTYSRTKMLFNDFVDVLKIPDITVLTPIMGSREPNDPTITSAKLAAQIPGSVLVDSLQAAADWVKQNAQPGDLVITLGCGDSYKTSITEEKVGVAACIGATWIGGGVAGTIELLAKSLCTGGIILIGEPYWRQLPPTEDGAKACHANAVIDFLILPELLASFGDLNYDVVEMVLADQEGWDRYEAAKWLTMRRWLEANPDDDFAKEVRTQLTLEPKRYATYTREYLGWGVFALMAR